MAQMNRDTARSSWRLLTGVSAGKGESSAQGPQQQSQAIPASADSTPGIVWEGRPPYPVYLNHLPMNAPEAFGQFGF